VPDAPEGEAPAFPVEAPVVHPPVGQQFGSSYDRPMDDSLRALMRRFPSGVAVVAVNAGGQELALTVGTLVSLSLEPPLVGFGVRRDAALHELLREAGAFAASLLAAGQEALAQHFARGVPPIALWEGIARRSGPETGAALLDGALGWIEARLASEQDAGDHTWFTGEVLATEPGSNAGPLLHVGGGFRSL
jgi:flavin reductase (DIM6/NTAB) family NADH-FMN oxidoreductase RutF